MPGKPPDPAPISWEWPQAEPPSASGLLLARLRSARDRLAPASPVARALRRIETRLLRPPVIAVLGESRTGKSSLAGLLLRNSPQATSLNKLSCLYLAPILFRYGERQAACGVGTGGVRFALKPGQAPAHPLRYIEAHLPLDCLRHYEILDVPGMADPARDGSQLLSAAARCANLAIWCTMATQAWKGSEQRLWLSMPSRLRAVSVLAATSKDSLRSESDEEKVLARLRREAAPHFGSVMLVSSVQAREACKTELDEPLLEGLPRYLFRLVATQKDRTSVRAGRDELWKASGAQELFAGLSGVLDVVQANRQQSAARAARGVARLALGSIGAGNPATGIANAWTALAGELTDTLGRAAVDDALFARFAGDLSDFATNSLGPALRPVLGEQDCAEIGDLFRCSADDLAEAADGPGVEAARQQLRAILAQLQEELPEALGRLPEMSGQNPALQPLSELAL